MLNSIDPRGPRELDKKKIKAENKQLIEEIAAFQRLLFAEDKQSILIVLQGLDAAGKDGAVRSIFSGINPLGSNVFSLKNRLKRSLRMIFYGVFINKCHVRG